MPKAAPMRPVDPGVRVAQANPGQCRPWGDFPVTIATPQQPDLAYATASPARSSICTCRIGQDRSPWCSCPWRRFHVRRQVPSNQQARTDYLLAGLCCGQRQLPAERGSQGAGPNPGRQDRRALAARPRRGISPESGQIRRLGSSAGGNLVALLGTSCGVAALEGAELGHADQPSCIQAAVDWFGPIDFLQLDEQFRVLPASEPQPRPIPRVAGDRRADPDRPDLVKMINPIHVYLVRGLAVSHPAWTEDCLVPPQQSQLLFDALMPAIGVDKVHLTLLQGAATAEVRSSGKCQRAAGP